MTIGQLFKPILQKSKIIMLELPEESYFEQNYSTIKELQKKGYSSVYVSFHRPFTNISKLFKQRGVDMKKIIFIDVATALTKENQEEHARCVHISKDVSIDELVRAIYTSLYKLKGKKLIFIDSLTTLTLYKPLSEILRFFEFLMRTVKNEKDVKLILNVPRDLAQKKFIQDIALGVDKKITVNYG